MRLIDADELLKAPFRITGNLGGKYPFEAITVKMIESAPTIDPIRVAGGCRCGECCFGCKPRSEYMQYGYVYCEQQHEYKEFDAFCSDGVPREAQDDG